MQLYITREKVLILLPEDIILRIALAPHTEEEVETHSYHSMASELPL
jgi:hypothetical protein